MFELNEAISRIKDIQSIEVDRQKYRDYSNLINFIQQDLSDIELKNELINLLRTRDDLSYNDLAYLYLMYKKKFFQHLDIHQDDQKYHRLSEYLNLLPNHLSPDDLKTTIKDTLKTYGINLSDSDLLYLYNLYFYKRQRQIQDTVLKLNEIYKSDRKFEDQTFDIVEHLYSQRELQNLTKSQLQSELSRLKTDIGITNEILKILYYKWYIDYLLKKRYINIQSQSRLKPQVRQELTRINDVPFRFDKFMTKNEFLKALVHLKKLNFSSESILLTCKKYIKYIKIYELILNLREEYETLDTINDYSQDYQDYQQQSKQQVFRAIDFNNILQNPKFKFLIFIDRKTNSYQCILIDVKTTQSNDYRYRDNETSNDLFIYNSFKDICGFRRPPENEQTKIGFFEDLSEYRDYKVIICDDLIRPNISKIVTIPSHTVIVDDHPYTIPQETRSYESDLNYVLRPNLEQSITLEQFF
jgi:hypothetical protein